MKNFSINRFWKYFGFEFHKAKRELWITVLICGAMPLIMYLMNGLFTLIFIGEWVPNTSVSKFVAFISAYISIVLSFPTKMYGGLTDKRRGSDWLMIPASTLEKFASAMLLSLVVVPVVTFSIFIGVDELMGLTIRSYNGLLSHNLPQMLEYGRKMLQGTNMETIIGGFDLCSVVVTNWCQHILIFILGSIIFKRAKIAKTFLSVMLVGYVFGLLLIFFSVNGSLLQLIPESPEAFKVAIWCISYGTIALLAGGVYYRFRTIKH